VRRACSSCKAHISGEPSDPVVSHGFCVRECWDFGASVKEFRAEILSPDPAVAAFAVRLPSETEPGKSYEVALLVDERESVDRYGDVVDVPCGLSWSCECRRNVLGAATCKHIVKAIHLHTLRGRMLRAKSARRAS
jgi:hypothetical protein